MDLPMVDKAKATGNNFFPSPVGRNFLGQEPGSTRLRNKVRESDTGKACEVYYLLQLSVKFLQSNNYATLANGYEKRPVFDGVIHRGDKLAPRSYWTFSKSVVSTI